MRKAILITVLLYTVSPLALAIAVPDLQPSPANTPPTAASFPAYLRDGFDFASFTRFDAPAPPKTLIYQSNGFMALQERGFGGQKLLLPVAGPPAPTNSSEVLPALEIDAPVFKDSSQHSYAFDTAPAKRSMTYFADRTVYHASFPNGPAVTLTVYPVYGKSVAVFRVKIDHANGPTTVAIQSRGTGFRLLPGADTSSAYGSPKWPYRAILAAKPQATAHDQTFQWTLTQGEEASLLIGTGGTESDARSSLTELDSSPDLFDHLTHNLWNQYLASAALVAPAKPIQFEIGSTGQHHSISPEDLVRSELWFWRGALNTTCQVKYLPACPMTIADWNVFMGMWSNDGIAEALSLTGTNRSDIARAAILNWFRYSVNATGDGTTAWTIFPSGKSTFEATGPERETQGIPAQATVVGEYIRLTGDASILNEKLGGPAKDRTLWQALLAYQNNLLRVRDANHDHLIDWLHTYETGWDDKDSPFIDLKGQPTSAMNEQVFNLWSLQEMSYLARLKGDDPAPWAKEFDLAQQAIRTKLWDNATQRYWDLDTSTNKLWTQGENLDAYYYLYFEKDPARISAMMQRLNNPAKFNGALLPSLAFDTPHWGGYWRGPAWTRIFGYIGMALTHAGQQQQGFDWLARAISSNLGPLLPETVDPKAYPPGEHANGSVRIMGYDTLDTLIFPDVAGLRTWAGQDLTVMPPVPSIGKVYIRGQHWNGDRYDAILDPGRPTQLWRNQQPLSPMDPEKVWQAHKDGESVTFHAVQQSVQPTTAP
jgi:hypothetical protein